MYSQTEHRLLKITKSFGLKMMKDDRFQYLFPQNQNNTHNKGKYSTPLCKTRRMKLSAIPKFIEFGNELLDRK